MARPKAGTTIEDRFFALTQRGENCWLWSGSRNKCGYGRFRVKQAMCLAHRVSYSLFVGPIPDGMYVLHRCDTPQCVNPGHLFVGDQRDNMQDAKNKGRTLKGSQKYFSKLTESEVASIRSLRADGETMTAIGRKFGVSCQTISSILRNTAWTHVLMDIP